MDARALQRFAIAPFPMRASWCAISLRLIAGFGFVEHGYAELSTSADAFIGVLHATGMPFAAVLRWAIVVEVICDERLQDEHGRNVADEVRECRRFASPQFAQGLV
jgi:hypothetical protein